jgi:hypothetical protein
MKQYIFSNKAYRKGFGIKNFLFSILFVTIFVASSIYLLFIAENSSIILLIFLFGSFILSLIYIFAYLCDQRYFSHFKLIIDNQLVNNRYLIENIDQIKIRRRFIKIYGQIAVINDNNKSYTISNIIIPMIYEKKEELIANLNHISNLDMCYNEYFPHYYVRYYKFGFNIYTIFLYSCLLVIISYYYLNKFILYISLAILIFSLLKVIYSVINYLTYHKDKIVFDSTGFHYFSYKYYGFRSEKLYISECHALKIDKIIIHKHNIDIYGDIRYHKQLLYLGKYKDISNKIIKKISIPRIFDKELDILTKLDGR